MSPKLKLVAILVALVLSFSGGYTVANWHQDSIELAAEKAAQKSADKFSQEQSDISAGVIASLDQWKNSNVKIQREIIREKLQPVFSNQCITDDYKRMFNEQTNSLSKDSTTKPAAKTRD